jgi:hypothetical protein
MICHGDALPTKKLKCLIFSLERRFKRVCAGLLEVVSTGKHIVFDDECGPSISVLFDNAWVNHFQAASPGGDHGRHSVAEGVVVMYVDPKTSMIREGTEAKFKVPANGDINRWRSKDTINRIGASIKGCRGMGAMS